MSEKEQGTPQYEVARLQHALAEDARTAELGVDVTIVEDAVVLSGQVVGPRRRAALGEVIAEQAPSLVVRNDVQVVPAAEPDAPPGAGAIRIAAVGDVHLGPDTAGRLRPALEHLPECADVLLLAGDLTRRGTAAEAEAAAAEFADLGVPVLAVLGNHDHHSDAADEVAGIFDHRGIRMLEGQAEVLDIGGIRLGVAGAKGFGGGFAGRCGSAFGEREMKAFIEHTEYSAELLHSALQAASDSEVDVLVALTHYAPVPDTLHGEPLEIYPFLGSYQLAEAIDAAGADLAVHGHAHAGSERGTTPGGVAVRNVAQPVIESAYAVYRVPAGRLSAASVP